MAFRGAMLLALVALALPATSAAPSATWIAAPADSGPVLGLVWEGTGWRLARIEPASLEPTGRRVYVGRSWGSWAFAPDRSLLAVAAQTVTGRSVVRILDPASLQQRSTVRLTHDLGAVAWPAPDRVLALSPGAGFGAIEVVAYDPLARRVVRRAKLTGTLLRTARTPGGLALLLGPEEGLGTARFAVVDANGVLRTTALDLIAGLQQPDGEPWVFRQRMPGLAVDPDGGRAFVVPAEGRVLEIDLATLAVHQRELSVPVSALGRLRDWLEPAAQAKASDGPVRYARWLGNGLLAVSGSDNQATVRAGRIERQTSTPAGLKLIDTQTWSVRTVDERARGFLYSEGLVLATGGATGLVAYSPYGEHRFTLFAGREPWISSVVDGKAYVGFGGGPDQPMSIVDLGRGEVVGERQGIVPQLLLGAADPWSG
ncbi:MAG: hypothetical protein WD689_00400 [Gaiellaceae bacterium]